MKSPNSNQPRIRPIALAVILALSSMSGASHAAPAESSAPAEAPVTLEKVVVTANKRAQNLQDVPAAISVMNDATLQRSNVRDINDLPALSPALTVTPGAQPGNNSINMRGIGTFSLGIGVESDVSVVIDDIPMGIQANAFKDLADVNRIEVLKGPQSTLLGKSSIAGALNITTKPIETNWHTRTSTLLTNDHEFRVNATTSGALSDTVRMRVSASRSAYGGPVNNLAMGEHIDGSFSSTVAGKFEWTPNDNLEVVFSPHANRTENRCCVLPYSAMTPGGLYRNIPQLPASSTLAGIHIGPNNVDIRNDYFNGGLSRDAGAGLKVAYTFPDDSPLAKHVLSSITSYSSYHMDDANDNDGIATDVASYLLVNGKPSGLTGGLTQYGTFGVQSRTQELRLTSPDSGAFRYVAGLWYGDNRLQRQLTKAPVSPSSTAYGSTARNTSYALFGQSSWEFAPKTSLITGLRLNREDTGYTFTRYTPPPAAPVATEYYQQKDSNNDVTGKIGLEHQVDRDTMVYGLFSTGHKGVAYDLTSGFSAAVAKNQPVPAETAKNYELGTKLTLLGGRAMLNLDVFRTDFKGFQQSAGFFDPDGIYRTTLHSIGSLRTSGFEADANFRVSRELMLNGSFAYTKAIITDFENGPCYTVLNAAGATVPGGNCAPNPKFNNSNVANLSGAMLPNAPKVKVNLGAQYDLSLAEQTFNAFIGGTYRWQSATQYSLNQDPATIQGAYGIANLNVGIKDKKDKYKLSFFVNNLFDQRYALGLANNLGSVWDVRSPNPDAHQVNTTQWLPPRDYTRYFGARLDLSF